MMFNGIHMAFIWNWCSHSNGICKKHSKKRLNSEENGHLDTADSQIVENLPIKSNQSKAHNHFLHFRINLGGKPWSYQPLQTIWIWGKDITSSTASDKILPGHL